METGKPHRKHLWLFAIPVLTVPLSLGLRAITQPHPYLDADLGTFPTYLAGETAALHLLPGAVKAHPDKINFTLRWAVGKKGGDPGNAFVGLSYQRGQHRIHAFDLKSNKEPVQVGLLTNDPRHPVITRLLP